MVVESEDERHVKRVARPVLCVNRDVEREDRKDQAFTG